MAFGERGLNLTKLESRPDRQTPWQYLFYLDVAGRASDPEMTAALDEVREQGGVVTVLGVYENWPGAVT